jgi:hypothetical protein
MKRNIYILLFGSLLIFNISCNNNNDNRSASDNDEYSSQGENNESKEEGNKNGTYCAQVEYYNPSTGTRNTYDLDVEVEGGELTEIHWPNGGWLDDTHFNPEDITNGECEFTSDRGYRYTVILGEFGSCGYTDENKIRQDVNE